MEGKDSGKDLIDLTRESDEAETSGQPPNGVKVEDHSYTVKLQTGKAKWGGTDAQVFVTLIGDLRASPEIQLKHGMLKRGSLAEDQIITPHVGNLLKVTIRHDGVGWAGAWHLQKVTIVDENLHRHWSFESTDWLNSDNKNSVTLKPKKGIGAGQMASRRRSNIFHCQNDSEDENHTTVKAVFKTVHFSRDCVTVYIIGNRVELGSWKPDLALRMERIVAFDGTWRGNWELEVEMDDVDNLEYKYICTDDETKRKVWESAVIQSVRTIDEDGKVEMCDRIETPKRVDKKKQYSLTPGRKPQSGVNPSQSSNLVSSFVTPSRPSREVGRKSSYAASGDDRSHTTTPTERTSVLKDNVEPKQSWQKQSVDGTSQAPQSGGNETVEMQLRAVRNQMRQREREIACLRAQTMINQPSKEGAAAAKQVFQQVVLNQLSEMVADTRKQLQELKDTVNEPVTMMFEEIDNARFVFSEVVETLNEEIQAANEAKAQAELALEESRAESEKTPGAPVDSPELLEELENLKYALSNAERQRDQSEKLMKSMEEDLTQATERYKKEFTERRRLFNTVQELKGNIRVFCRVRPPKTETSVRGVELGGLENGEYRRISVGPKKFEFDRVFAEKENQKTVYSETASVVTSVLDGYNACVFAYGQTGSGKTYTMNGSPSDPGVNLLALKDLYRLKEERSDVFDINISVTMVEIYNETLRDLLVEDRQAAGSQKLEIKKGPDGVFIPDLTTTHCTNAAQMWDVMARGANNRFCSATAMNERSSRSHLIVSVNVQSVSILTKQRTVGNLHLVDLAGSERVSRSQAVGDRLREAAHINKSLAALGDVFMGILARNPHVPFRNSKLTYLLQESIGGNSKTIMFVNVSPEDEDSQETVCSLMFASRVAKVELGQASKKADNLELGRLGREVHEREQQNKALSSKVQELGTHLESRNAHVRKLEEELVIVKAKRDSEMRARLEADAAISNLENLNKQHEKLVGSLEKKLGQAEERYDELIASQQKRIRVMENKLEEVTKENESILLEKQEILQKNNSDNSEAFSSMKSRLQRAIDEKDMTISHLKANLVQSEEEKQLQVTTLGESRLQETRKSNRELELQKLLHDKESKVSKLEEKLEELMTNPGRAGSTNDDLQNMSQAEQINNDLEERLVQTMNEKEELEAVQEETIAELQRVHEKEIQELKARFSSPRKPAVPKGTRKREYEGSEDLRGVQERSSTDFEHMARVREGAQLPKSGNKFESRDTSVSAATASSRAMAASSAIRHTSSARERDFKGTPMARRDSRSRFDSSTQATKISKVRTERDSASRSLEIGKHDPVKVGQSAAAGSKQNRSVTFAPTISVTSSTSTRPKLPPSTPSAGGAKRVVYAFGTRVELGQEGNAEDENNSLGTNVTAPTQTQSAGRKQNPASFSRPAQRVIAPNTPNPKAQAARRFPA